SIGINKWWYFPSETVTSTASSIRFECCNNVHESWANAYFGFDGGSQALVTSGYQHRSGSLELHEHNISYDGGGSANKSAPAVPGLHNVNYRFYFTNTYGETGNYYSNATLGIKGIPSATISSPANGSSHIESTGVRFTGNGNLNHGGGSITYYAWIKTNSGTDSYLKRTCSGSHGTVISQGPTKTTFLKSDLPLGFSRICLAVRQTYDDGTYRWSGARSAWVDVNVVKAPVHGTCNSTVAKTYASSATTWSPGVFCTSGTPIPTSPAFPAQGATTSWTCSGANGGSNDTCSASREAVLVPRDGVCNSTVAKTYLYEDTGFSPGSYCTVGLPDPAIPAFPDPGATTTWTCKGVNGGSDSIPPCNASRNGAPVCVPDGTYTDYICTGLPGESEACSGKCGQKVNAFGTCTATDSCGEPGKSRPSQECTDNGATCTAVYNCPACDESTTPEYIEVNP
ncbi:hypothetical protein ACFL3M_03775, partial [Patescibacteria group bacterium]